jgi:hypothetical protein
MADFVPCGPTKKEYWELEKLLATDLGGVTDTADLMYDTHLHANNRFFDEWDKFKGLRAHRPNLWQKDVRFKTREGRLVHRHRGKLRWDFRFNPVVWFTGGKYGKQLTKDPNPNGELVHISHNLMLNYYADYNKGNRLAAQLMLEKSELLTDPEKKAKVRRQALRLDQRIVEGVEHPTVCLDSDDESYSSKESQLGTTWYEYRKGLNMHDVNPMCL